MAKRMKSALSNGTTCHLVRTVALVRMDNLNALHRMMRIFDEVLGAAKMTVSTLRSSSIR